MRRLHSSQLTVKIYSFHPIFRSLTKCGTAKLEAGEFVKCAEFIHLYLPILEMEMRNFTAVLTAFIEKCKYFSACASDFRKQMC